MMDSVPGYPTGGYDPRGQYIPTSAERTAYQAERVPWADQVVYGYYTLAFPLGVLVLAALAKVVFDVRVKRVATKVGKVGKVYGRVAAALRLATYPRTSKYPSVWTWGPLGPNLILLAGLLLASGLTWINSYYYYAPYYGSAPLYLRSEWVAMATLPFV